VLITTALLSIILLPWGVVEDAPINVARLQGENLILACN
jgi:hypothetical protein